MSFCRLLLFALMLSVAFGCVEVRAEDGRREGERNREALLKYLRPALNSAGRIGRLYYTTVCHAKDGYPIPFPSVKAQMAANGETGLAAVRSVFRNNKEVVVTRNRSGLVQITIGKPPSAILQTKIHSLTFEPYDQYNPIMAIGAILSTDEFKTAMRTLGLDLPLIIADMNILEPAKGLPHLPALLKDLTVDQAFDLIAKTFGGVVSYGTCAGAGGEHLIYINFFEVAASDVAGRR